MLLLFSFLLPSSCFLLETVLHPASSSPPCAARVNMKAKTQESFPADIYKIPLHCSAPHHRNEQPQPPSPLISNPSAHRHCSSLPDFPLPLPKSNRRLQMETCRVIGLSSSVSLPLEITFLGCSLSNV